MSGSARGKTLTLVLALALVLGSALPARTAASEADTPQSFAENTERLTRDKLSGIEKQLREKLADHGLSFGDRMRDRFIRLSMWGPLAGMSQWTLETLGDSPTARKVLFFAMPFVRWMSAPFIFPVEPAGNAEETAASVQTVFSLISRLRQEGYGATLDNVGDASLSPEDARAYRAYYNTLINNFIKDGTAPELNMSLKLSALVHDLESAVREPGSGAAKAKQAQIKAALANLLQAASQAPDKKIFLRIDMEEYKYKDMTLRLFREVVEENPATARDARGDLRLGVVIQAYLRDSARDVKELAQWAGERGFKVPIRLVKGAYLIQEREEAASQGRKSPVWNFKPSTDANFEGICAYMLLNKSRIQSAFATHNIRSQTHAMALAEMLGIPKKEVELQMLYGMGGPIKAVAASMGYPMREYVPAGSFARGLKYAGRRFQELANSDNALAKTLRGDFSAVGGGVPVFQGEEDIRDGRVAEKLVREALARHFAGTGE